MRKVLAMLGRMITIGGTLAVGLLASALPMSAVRTRKIGVGVCDPILQQEAAMCFRRLFLAALAVGMWCTCAAAGDLSISFDDPASPSVHNIQWNTTSASPVMVFGIDNITSTTDKLYGWQLGLEIVPESGATPGGLRFKTATLPTSYLLEGRSGGLTPSFSGPAATISVIGDTDGPYTGVLVPSSGKNLLQVSFDALPGASGLYDIKAVPDLFNGSNWFSDVGGFAARDFVNVPFGGGAVELGTVNVSSTPEPSTMALLASGLLVAGVPAFRRWVHRRRARKAVVE